MDLCDLMASCGSVLEEIVSKANQLSVDCERDITEGEDAVSEEDWVIETENNNSFLNKAIVGRLFAKKHCNRKFLRMDFGRI